MVVKWILMMKRQRTFLFKNLTREYWKQCLTVFMNYRFRIIRCLEIISQVPSQITEENDRENDRSTDQVKYIRSQNEKTVLFLLFLYIVDGQRVSYSPTINNIGIALSVRFLPFFNDQSQMSNFNSLLEQSKQLTNHVTNTGLPQLVIFHPYYN